MRLPDWVDGSLVRLKLHYLLHGLGGSPLVPYGSLVGRQLGVSAQGMGLVAVLPSLVINTLPPRCHGCR